MRVLWFTNTPSLFDKDRKGYNGGGWIESLERIVSSQRDIELGISFMHNDVRFKVVVEDTTYYPISMYSGFFQKVKHQLFYSRYDKYEIEEFKKIIEDFQPDIIHVFGSEGSFGLLAQELQIPVVIHIQGILNPTLNAYYPPGLSFLRLVEKNLFSPIRFYKAYRSKCFFAYNAKREVEIFRGCKYFMGRTTWDRNVVKLFSPNSTYYLCNEVLREDFYNSPRWVPRKREKIYLVSTLSRTTYKGFDLVLKTAKILSSLSGVSFVWDVFGISDYKEFEEIFKIYSKDVHVRLKGVVDGKTLVNEILGADIFVHPSYIDNSPNSICEAQMLGIPVISTNVGGVSSLVEDGKTGFLVPANDPFSLASCILDVKKSFHLLEEISENAYKTARLRHDKDAITSELLNIYQSIQSAKSNN